MNKLSAIACSLLMIVLFAGCSEEENPVITDFINAPATVTVQYGPDTDAETTFTLEADCAWTIQSHNGWINVTPSYGTGSRAITVKADTNYDYQQRVGSFTISGPNTSYTVEVRQLSHPLDVTPTEFTVEAKSSTKPIEINGNQEWTATSHADWIHLSQTHGIGQAYVDVTIDNNTTTDRRQGYVTVSWGHSSQNCLFEQAAGTLPEITTATVTNIGKDSFTVSISANSMFPITGVGFYYSETNPAPDQLDMNCAGSVATNDGSIARELTASSLTPNTTYYVRPYAESAVGIQLGEVFMVNLKGTNPGENDNPFPSN